MPSELAVESFLDLVRQSGVISQDDLQRLLGELKRHHVDLQNPRKAADELVAREALTRWQADQLLQGRHRGFLLGPYCLLELLGKGGMGTVYLAEHQMLRRRCAIKVLPSKQVKDDQSIVDRFYREAQAVAALDHPNIVRAYDVNKIRINRTQYHYLVMEYVQGQDLQRMVESHGVLEFRDAAGYIRQAAQGLQHAHQRGLVHRDMKPANLLVDTGGVVKLLDLGLVRFLVDDADALLTDEHGESILGTADYLAPEQAINSHSVDARADIYGLGQTFYFLLTGHAPFPEGTVAERLLAHQTKSPQPVTDVRPDAPLDLVTIIDKMTAKKPEHRYQETRQVGEVLDEWLRDHADDSGLSRCSLLLGGAGRSPSPARREPTRAASAATEETELELAPLDEDQPPPSPDHAPAAKRDKASGDRTSGESRLAGPQSDSTPPPCQTGPQTGTQQELLDDLPDLTELASDLMAALADDDSTSTVLGGRTVSGPVAESGPFTIPSPKKPKPEGVLSALLGSPAVWLGAAGLVVIVLVLAFVFSRPSQDKAPQGKSTAAPGSPTVQPPLPPEQGPTGHDGPDNGKPDSPDPPEKLPTPAVVPQKTGPAISEPPAKKTASRPRRNPKQAHRQRPKRDPKQDPKPAPKKAPAEKRPDARLLLAGLTELSYELKSIDPNPKGRLNLMIERSADLAIQRAGLKKTQDGSAVMQLTLEAVKVDKLVGIVLSAELKCRHGDSQVVQVWQHRRQVAAVTPQALRRGIPATMRKGVTEFFSKFLKDHRDARAEMDQKRPPEASTDQ